MCSIHVSLLKDLIGSIEPEKRMSNLYSHREEQNNNDFERLSQTLHQFRATVDRDIYGRIQQEGLILDSLGDSFGQLWTKVKRSSGDLQNVMSKNYSLTRIVLLLLAISFVLWTLLKLKWN